MICASILKDRYSCFTDEDVNLRNIGLVQLCNKAIISNSVFSKIVRLYYKYYRVTT